MLYKYFTEKLLGLQDVDIEKIGSILNVGVRKEPTK